MDADDNYIVRTLKQAANSGTILTGRGCASYISPLMLDAAAGLIVSLRSQLAESQRRERAAVEDMRSAVFWTDECREWCNQKKCSECRSKDKFEWRGPQPGGEEAE